MAKTTKRNEKADTESPVMMAALAAFNPAAASAWFDLMSESARFVTDRLQQDFETQKALLGCKTPSELMQVQTEFYQTAIEQYTAEATRLFEMMSRAAIQSAEEAVATHKRGYDDVPL